MSETMTGFSNGVDSPGPGLLHAGTSDCGDALAT